MEKTGKNQALSAGFALFLGGSHRFTADIDLALAGAAHKLRN
jgi:hypothetical protein